ncbi:hypothetical protein [Microbacterium laevaniformans]|uniref:hypothetical protein n=1 Tax=Microbacterium laevaniformans TaxID=36807 RepID=UPI00142E456E|nr:hypothetical protein [Microbacterium laevaniformans]
MTLYRPLWPDEVRVISAFVKTHRDEINAAMPEINGNRLDISDVIAPEFAKIRRAA